MSIEKCVVSFFFFFFVAQVCRAPKYEICLLLKESHKEDDKICFGDVAIIFAKKNFIYGFVEIFFLDFFIIF